ncbi:MarR family winged helix-turn-helix transcriptional regulator, partial [Rhizobium johnstonii]
SLNRPEPPPMGPVAALLAMDQTTLTAALKPLQRKGWVKVMENPRYRRGRLLSLTPEGKAVLAKALQILPQPGCAAFRQLSVNHRMCAFPDRQCFR